MHRRTLMTAAAAAAVVAAVPARAQLKRPVVVELFTSQGCSSCPPAEALLTDLASGRPDVLALSFHVTYWNGLGWGDPFSLEAATLRQRRYARLLPSEVYTPQMVVDGTHDVVGSDRSGVIAAIAAAAARQDGPDLTLHQGNGQVEIAVGAGDGEADLVVIGYDGAHRTAVRWGENAGRTLAESNVVRALSAVGTWRGTALRLAVPLPQGERVAAILQASDGRILTAAASAAQPEAQARGVD